jgi:hypothetical protein
VTTSSFFLFAYIRHSVHKQRQDYLETTLSDRGISVEQWLAEEYPDLLSLSNLLQFLQRTALMGKQDRMMDDLQQIRQWHVTHGFKGGLVLRDLTKPVFQMATKNSTPQEEQDNNSNNKDNEDWTLQEIIDDPTRLARRECYYLYYEIKGDGQVIQQLFCRGTTLRVDVMTCLEAWMEVDVDLNDCRIHKGFANQADRILKDVLPLLLPPTHPTSSIEICGHSLGGAVAMILAAKLRQRGYNVTQVISIAEPRFCWSQEDAVKFTRLLPKTTLRIEHDHDFVPFLPPFGSHPIIPKLWLLQEANDKEESSTGSIIRVVDPAKHPWVDSAWLNFRFKNIIQAGKSAHRMPSYINMVKQEIVE